MEQLSSNPSLLRTFSQVSANFLDNWRKSREEHKKTIKIAKIVVEIFRNKLDKELNGLWPAIVDLESRLKEAESYLEKFED